MSRNLRSLNLLERQETLEGSTGIVHIFILSLDSAGINSELLKAPVNKRRMKQTQFIVKHIVMNWWSGQSQKEV